MKKTLCIAGGVLLSVAAVAYISMILYVSMEIAPILPRFDEDEVW